MPYKVLFIAVDSDALGGAKLGQAVVADMHVEGVNRPPTAREGAIIAAIAKTMGERELTKAISFHSHNANAERFVQYAGAMFEERQELDISLERVDGKMSTEDCRRCRPLGAALRRAAGVHAALRQLQCACAVAREPAAGDMGPQSAPAGSEDHARAHRAAGR